MTLQINKVFSFLARWEMFWISCLFRAELPQKKTVIKYQVSVYAEMATEKVIPVVRTAVQEAIDNHFWTSLSFYYLNFSILATVTKTVLNYC